MRLGNLDQMTSLQVYDCVSSTVRELDKEWHGPGELAYYALTSKIEGQIRDKLAFALHRQLEKDGFVVSREWNRTDIAVLDTSTEPESARLLLELKAMFTSDGDPDLKRDPIGVEVVPGARRCDEYVRHIMDDNAKIIQTLENNPSSAEEVLGAHLLTAVHFPKGATGSDVPRKFWWVKKCYMDEAASGRVLEACASTLDGGILTNKWKLGEHGFWDAGEAFGIPVHIYYWLIGPDTIGVARSKKNLIKRYVTQPGDVTVVSPAPISREEITLDESDDRAIERAWQKIGRDNEAIRTAKATDKKGD